MKSVFVAALVLVSSSLVYGAGGSSNLGNGSGEVPTTPGLKSDSAEYCLSGDGRRLLVRSFSTEEALYREASTDPREKPQVKEKYRYEKDAGGTSTRAAVEPDMFDLMAEPFGGSPQPRPLWAGQYETHFKGKVSVFDNNNQHVGTFEMDCHGALLEYN